MSNLLRAEWLKLTRRPLTWILLVIFLSLMLLYFALPFLIIAFNDGTFTGGETRIQLLSETQLDQYRRQLSFPGVFGAVLGQVNSIGGICAIILAAGALGSEYGWGTLRTQLARYPQRGRYLVAKIIALILVLLLGIAIAVVVGSGMGLLFGILLGNPGAVRPQDILLLPLGIVRSLYVLLPYVLFTLACCALGRSVLAGAAGGLVFLTLDISAGALAVLSEISGPLTFVYNLLVQQNINVLVIQNSQSFGLDPSQVTNLNLQALPSPLQAIIVIALYSAGFFAMTYRWLVRRDITGAA